MPKGRKLTKKQREALKKQRLIQRGVLKVGGKRKPRAAVPIRGKITSTRRKKRKLPPRITG